jgi:hypothetical protein
MKTSGISALFAAIAGSMAACSSTPNMTTPPTGSTNSDHAVSPTTSASTTPVAGHVDPPKPESPFIAVATLPGDHLYGLDNALVISHPVGNPEGIGFSVVEGDKVVDVDKTTYKSVLTIPFDVSGTWPDDVHATFIGTTGRTGIAWVSTLHNGAWKDGTWDTSYVWAATAKSGKNVFAIERSASPFGGVGTLVNVSGPATTRKLTPVNKKACEDYAKTLSEDEKYQATEWMQSSEVAPASLGGSASGLLFSVGFRCTGDFAVETWPAGSTKSTITSLEAPKGHAFNTPIAVAGGAGDDAWIFSKPAYHYDGKTWTKVDFTAAISKAVVAPDGTVWAVDTDGSLFKGGLVGFQKVTIPEDAKVSDLAMTGEGNVWIAAGDALMRLKKQGDGASSVKVATTTAPANTKKAPRFEVGGKNCNSNVVVLYGFTKVTPDDYDFPLTRKALKGHTELDGARFVVTKDGGQKFFAALPRTFDQAVKIAGIIEKGVQGSKPQIVCANPEIVREVELNLATGEVVK